MVKKSSLEEVIANAATGFALEIVNAVKAATLQELMELQSDGRATGVARKAGRKPGRKPATSNEIVDKEKKPRKKRVVTNYPKCAFPGCENNRFPRGKGFCGQHWNEFKEGKISDAASYKQQ